MKLTKSEQAAHDRAVRIGLTVLRNGWPDFLCVGKGGPLCIEVKSGMDRIGAEQAAMFAALERAGVEVVVCRGAGSFVNWREDVRERGLRGTRRPMRGLMKVRLRRVNQALDVVGLVLAVQDDGAPGWRWLVLKRGSYSANCAQADGSRRLRHRRLLAAAGLVEDA